MTAISESAFRELAAVTRAVGTSTRLSKVLADATLPAAAKVVLLGDVTRGVLDVNGEAARVLRTAFEQHNASTSLNESLLDVTAHAGFGVADGKTGGVADNGTGGVANAQSRLSNVENDLLSIASLIEDDSSLRFALTNPGATDAVKQQLMGELLGGKVDSIAIELVQVLIALDHGQKIVDRVQWLASLAAKQQGHVVADVRSAVELDENYRNKVTAVLVSAVGKPVNARFVVDPTIVGSLVVRVGDEVWDGSVRRRLEQAREALTGAS